MKYRASIATIIFSLLFLQYISDPSSAHAQIKTLKACEVENAPPVCNQGNMWAVDVTSPVPNGAYVHVPDPGCMNDATGDIARVLSAAIAVSVPNLALFSGTIGNVIAGPVGDYLKNQGGDIGKHFSPYAKNGALCAPVIAVVPKDATVIGYRLYIAEQGGDFTQCPPGADCIGWSKWQGEPVTQSNEAMQTATAIFMNWSHDRQRRARMIVFYRMPDGKQPLTQL